MVVFSGLAEADASFHAEKTAQSLYTQLGSKQAMATLHIVSRQLDEEIPRYNDSINAVETWDQGVSVVRIAERYAHQLRTKTVFRTKMERAAMPRQSDQSIQVAKEKSVAVMDCGA